MNSIPKEQLEVWLMRTPFSNYAEAKIRPIIIVSNNEYNKKLEDFLGVHITTRKGHFYSVPVLDADFTAGSLNRESFVRFDTVTRYEEKLLVKKIEIHIVLVYHGYFFVEN